MTHQPTEDLLNEILNTCPSIPLTLWNRLCRQVAELKVENGKLRGKLSAYQNQLDAEC